MPTTKHPDQDPSVAPGNRAERRAAARGRPAADRGGVPASRGAGTVHGRTKPARARADGVPRRTG